MLQIIIPIKQSFEKKDCFIRLFYNCKHLKKLNVCNILIADSTANPLLKKLNQLIALFFGYDYQSFPQKNIYTPAILKNKAAEYSFSHLGKKFIFYLDVDVFLNKNTLLYFDEMIVAEVDFEWIPVIFLNKNIGLKKAYSDLPYIFHDNENIEQIGYTTGAHFFSKELFNRLGGYSQEFYGYGCEDIELLHRATACVGIRENSEDSYYNDVRNHDSNLLKGFRKFFFDLKKDFPVNTMLIHIWHKRKNKSEYLKSRKKNDEILLKLMKEWDGI